MHAQRAGSLSSLCGRPAEASASSARSRNEDKKPVKSAQGSKSASKQEMPAVSAPVAMETETISL